MHRQQLAQRIPAFGTDLDWEPDPRTPEERARQAAEYHAAMAAAEAKHNAPNPDDLAWARLVAEGSTCSTFGSEVALYRVLIVQHQRIVQRPLGLSDRARIARVSVALWRELSAVPAACKGLGCVHPAHCEGCDQCQATTTLRLARGAKILSRVRWCDDCAEQVNAGQHDTYTSVIVPTAVVS